MINVKLMGGLGNQLFQFAMGRALEARGESVSFGTDSLGSAGDGTGGHHRDAPQFGLSGFSTGPLTFGGPTPSAPEVTDWDMPYRDVFTNLKDPSNFNGYWQSEKYLRGIEDRLRQELKPQLPHTLWKLAAKLETGNTVALHVRRGDYTMPVNVTYHGLCGYDYYLAAMGYIAARDGAPKIYVFSDDPEWCCENFPGFEVISTGNRFYDFWLMSLCKHSIIANSTYSWWASWLGDVEKQGRIVVAPKQWFVTPTLDARDIVPSSWVKI